MPSPHPNKSRGRYRIGDDPQSRAGDRDRVMTKSCVTRSPDLVRAPLKFRIVLLAPGDFVAPAH
jgi:hypothetical protein